VDFSFVIRLRLEDTIAFGVARTGKHQAGYRVLQFTIADTKSRPLQEQPKRTFHTSTQLVG
jgi:hypothetical protein